MQNWVDHLESLIYLLAHFGAGQDNLATDEDQKNNLGLDHTVDQTREELRFIGAEIVVAGGQPFEANREFDIAATDNVLDLEVGEFGIEAKLLNDAGILARSKLRIILRLGTGDDHLARSKDKGQ